jgi:hypothetical protein
MQDPSGGEGYRLIAEAYAGVRVADTAHVRPEDCESLEAFQAVYAAADEWAALGLIELLDNEQCAGEDWLVAAIRFRRLK